MDKHRLDRPTIFACQFLVVAALITGYIISVRPAMSPNDRSRWNTVWSLVEHGTYQMFDTPEDAKKYGKPQQFRTIDKVVKDGKSYSSKPPLLPTAIAWLVRGMKSVVGWPFEADIVKFQVPGSIHLYGKATLLVFQVLPFLLFLWLYRRYLDRLSISDTTYLFCLMAAGLGTFVTGYLVTLNNHVIAASFSFFTVYLLLRIVDDGEEQWWRFLVCGLCAGWTATNELPAGLLVVGAGLMALAANWKKAIAGYAVGVAILGGAFLWTNHQALGSYKPAYLQKELYDHPGSYWTDPERKKDRSGIDGLNDNPEPAIVYFLHMTVGHHGLFSLTPIWALAAYGFFLALKPRQPAEPPLFTDSDYALAVVRYSPRPWLGWLVLTISVGVFVFFWLVTDQRNYGGFCHGLRWLMWLCPLWLLFLPQALERMWTFRTGTRLAWAALAVSILSMADTLPGPWSRSWLHWAMLTMGIIDY